MECGVCMQAYDLAAHEPRALMCGHTVCKTCLENITRTSGAARCPWDRITDGRNINDIPRNRALAESVELEQQAAAIGRGLDLSHFWFNERDLELSDDRLGNGAISQVVAGQLRGRPVAVKLFSLGQAGGVPEHLRRELEVVLRVTGECHHACQYKGATVKLNQFCLIMKKYPKNLAQVITEEGGAGSMPEAKVVRYATQSLAALVELHAHKIIVADLKPANLLLDTTIDELVITDFGLSRCIEHTLGNFRPTTTSPELFELGDIACATDMWAWACTVIYMATGQMPFAGLSQAQITRMVCVQGRAPDIPQRLPSYLKSILQSCLAHEPAHRPTATNALQAMIERVPLTAATATAVADSNLQQMIRTAKREITSDLEKKMHVALDAALHTLRAETKKADGAKAAAEVGSLRREFEELTGAIKRNAMWLLQGPA